MNNTVRKFPRSLADAFPCERASSGDWERRVNYSMSPTSTWGHRAVLLVAVVTAAAWALSFFFTT
jgi:hypothetical protein